MAGKESLIGEAVMRSISILALLGLLFVGCTKGEQTAKQQEFWIYTSLYKDTISDLEPRLKVAFPNVKFQWFQAGSEDIAAKVGAELLAGSTKADLLISSDRFWYEDLASRNQLHAYRPKAAEAVPSELRNPKNFYTTVSLPVMVLGYNSDLVKPEQAPKSFKDIADPKWKGKVSGGDPLSSGTNFTTIAFLQHLYGWPYVEKLKANQVLTEGGNSAVIRRIQTGERPIGWVLLENLLRVQDDKRVKIVFPEDGVVLQNNVAAIVNKANGQMALGEQVAEWFFSKEGQEAMVRSYMYSPIPGIDAPKGAPPFASLAKGVFHWSQEFLGEVVRDRVMIKEKFAEIMAH